MRTRCHFDVKPTGARAKAWCLLIHAEASLSLSLSMSNPPTRGERDLEATRMHRYATFSCLLTYAFLVSSIAAGNTGKLGHPLAHAAAADARAVPGLAPRAARFWSSADAFSSDSSWRPPPPGGLGVGWAYLLLLFLSPLFIAPLTSLSPRNASLRMPPLMRSPSLLPGGALLPY